MGPAFPTPSNASEAVPNVGLLDQQAALLWVHANAAAFGAGDEGRESGNERVSKTSPVGVRADPAHVLLTGQSAGGSSVLFQLTLPASYPAYRAAMPQSPGAPVNTLAAGHATATGIATRLGCSASLGVPAQIACLRAVPVQSLVNAALAQVMYSPYRGPKIFRDNCNCKCCRLALGFFRSRSALSLTECSFAPFLL